LTVAGFGRASPVVDLSCEGLLARKIWEKPCRNADGSVVGFFCAAGELQAVLGIWITAENGSLGDAP
jgi:hypothetical protein